MCFPMCWSEVAMHRLLGPKRQEEMQLDHEIINMHSAFSTIYTNPGISRTLQDIERASNLCITA
jgi:hypothetical protein